MASLDSDDLTDPAASSKKPSFVRGLLPCFSIGSTPKAQEAGQDAASVPQPGNKYKKFLYLTGLSRAPPKWRLPILLGIIMLVTLCIVLSAVLSVVLSHETPHPLGGGQSAPPELPQPPNFRPILPPSYPLAVKNPYLSAWIPGEDALELPTRNVKFWAGQKLGWSVMVSVDNDTYSLMGVSDPPGDVQPARVDGAQYTSTKSDFYLTASNVNFTLSFLSPIFPGVDETSLSQQSLPLSFLTVTAQPKSGEPEIKIYSDIGHEWLGDEIPPTQISLSKTSNDSTFMWAWERGTTAVYNETHQDMAKWGQVFYASTEQDAGSMTMSFGLRDDIRTNFVSGKNLDTLSAPAPTWSGGGNPVSGYAHNLGKISKATHVVFGIGMTREKGIRFYGRDETYHYHAKYPNADQLIDAVSDAFKDLEATKAACLSLDEKTLQESLKVGGQNYSDITTLSLRQVFGAMDITIPLETKDTSQTNVWMKESSSNGDIQTLDILMPAAPIFYWLSPGYIRLLIRPVIVYLETGKWPHEWAVHDLGDRGFEDGGYPRANGHDNGRSEQMPLESSGNLLIMAYMYHKGTTNKDEADRFANDHKPLFAKYADYLRKNGLVPEKQLSTNDGLGPIANQTNLAIKSAVGLNAYAAMYNDTDARTAAKSMANKIITQEYGLSSDGSHLTFRYGRDESWFIMFNLYPDVLLGLETFPSDIIALQSRYYLNLHSMALDRGHIGITLGSPADFGSTMWFCHAGASAPENAQSDVGKMFIDDIHRFLANRKNDVPLDDRYFVNGPYMGMAGPKKTRWGKSFMARPVVGGHFAFLARARTTT